MIDNPPTTYLTDGEKEAFEKCEGIISRGLNSFIEVGIALLSIRDSKLYRESYATFEQYCRERWAFSRTQAYRLMDAAGVINDLSPNGGQIPANERQARSLMDAPAELRQELWQTALDTAPNGKVTAAHIEQTIREYPITAANHAISLRPDYDGDEWYTPGKYIEAAREVMGKIDLDPASCDEAQELIKASHYFTKKDNGLQKDWFGRVWLNPPYSAPLIDQFSEKLIQEYEDRRVSEAIILTNNSSDTRWFHSLLSRFPACFTRGRVQFWRKGEETFGARQGQAVFYLGTQDELFYNVFSEFGIVVVSV